MYLSFYNKRQKVGQTNRESSVNWKNKVKKIPPSYFSVGRFLTTIINSTFLFVALFPLSGNEKKNPFLLTSGQFRKLWNFDEDKKSTRYYHCTESEGKAFFQRCTLFFSLWTQAKFWHGKNCLILLFCELLYVECAVNPSIQILTRLNL